MSTMSLSQNILIKDSLNYRFNSLEVKELHKIIVDRDYLLQENGTYKMQIEASDIMINDYTLLIETKNSEISFLKDNLRLNGNIIKEQEIIVSTLNKQLKKAKLTKKVFMITTIILTGLLIIK